MNEETLAKVTKLQEAALAADDPAEAVSLLRNAMALAPLDVPTRAYLAQFLMQLKDPAEAIAALEDAPYHSDVLYFRAAALEALGRAEEAWSEFAAAVEAYDNRPPGSNVLVGVGQIMSMHALMLADKAGGSLSLLERAVARDPLFAMAWHFFGYFLFMAKELDAAGRALEISVGLDPDRVEQIVEDEDFDSFREDPRLVRAIEAKPLGDAAQKKLRETYLNLDEQFTGAALGKEIRKRLLAPPKQARPRGGAAARK
jgi:tetratricopeptide (TPR) repeat protein